MTKTFSIGVSNKRTEVKPNNIGAFIGDAKSPERLKFKTYELDIDTITNLIKEGYCFTYTYNDEEGRNRKNNFKSAGVIMVDIDDTSLTAEHFTSLHNPPTIIYSSFSHKQNNKRNCYHLIYCLNKEVENEQDFAATFEALTAEYKDQIDNNAKDCNRFSFTSNAELPYFELYTTDATYTPIVSENKPQNENKHINAHKEEVIEEIKINSTFMHDVRTLNDKDFFEKYDKIYPFANETEYTQEDYTNGYVVIDECEKEYIKVPSKKYTQKNGKTTPLLVKKGHRHNALFVDAIAFSKLFCDITPEHLFCCLKKQVQMFYDNKDGEINNKEIANTVKTVLGREERYFACKKKIKLSMSYYKQKGIDNALLAFKMAQQDKKENDLCSLYDTSVSLEDNIVKLTSNGKKYAKKTVVKWLKDNNVEYFTNKDKRVANNTKLIMELHNEGNGCKKISKILLDKYNIKLSHVAVQKIINNFAQNI